ncbi:putative 3,4-dihydroxy-2-butanone kinase isoform X3 [Mangifera indica]|uniref:putative 3,4-dihydroxy-2-butanone kinase isoform X3 n=1 Tax=Mangifera indica TaxID=29780 RepID=UPI001CF9E5DC|nr:putative 3,4-dihydroxy-2-butanone kinase isoform X3 [Mangifera indica]
MLRHECLCTRAALLLKTAIVGDDSALPPPQGIAGQRGLAGPILVYKLESQVAGASCCCWPFPFLSYSVTAEANRASEMVGKMGVALSVCTLPGQVSSCCLGSGKMELGLEINSCHSMVLMIVAGKAVPNLQLEHGLAVKMFHSMAIFWLSFHFVEKMFHMNCWTSRIDIIINFHLI